MTVHFSKLPSSYQKPITTIEPLFADLDEFSDDQLFDEEYDYEDVDVDHEMYMFESPGPPIPAMQIRSTPLSVPVPTPTSVQQHASRPPGRPPLAATFTCKKFTYSNVIIVPVVVRASSKTIMLGWGEKH